MSAAKKNSKKRVAVFVFYDKDGIVDRYVTYLVQELLKVSERLVVVCNGDLTEDGKKAIDELTDDVLVRENTGYDAWGYKAGIEYIGWEELKNYDELILMNDSVFGPIYPFETMFDEMDKRSIDFWGITKRGKTPNPFRVIDDEFFSEHIQAYFYSISDRLFSHSEFKRYWDGLPVMKTWEEAISFNEARFTEHFSKLGFSWGVFINPDELLDMGEFAYLWIEGYRIYELVKEYKLPVIKQKIFSKEHDPLHSAILSDSISKMFDYVRYETNYDTDMIWEKILRTMSPTAIRDNLNLNYVLPCGYISGGMDRARNDEGSDVIALYVSGHVEECDPAGFGEPEYNELKTFAHTNLIQYKPLTDEQIHQQRCFENVLTSKEYVANILNLFTENPRLGILFPPLNVHGYSAPCGMFWFRMKVLQKLSEYEWSIDEITGDLCALQIFCDAAQKEGYYSAGVMTDVFSAIEVKTLNSVLSETCKALADTNEALHLTQKSGFVRGIIKRLKHYPGLYEFARWFYRLPGIKLRKKNFPSIYPYSSDTEIRRSRYKITGMPLISIIIPNKDHTGDLKKCVESIFKLTTYSNYEIVIIENNSIEQETFKFYRELQENEKIKVIFWDKGFNYSAINNYGAEHANGDYLLFLNNDTEVITPDWLQEMLMFAQKPKTGAVGAMLYYPDDTIQHAGVILDTGGEPMHLDKHCVRYHKGHMNRLMHVHNLSAVTAACMMTPKKVFVGLGGFDERFPVAYNDIDLCMRIRKADRLIVFTPHAELYHYESKTRGYEDTPEKKKRLADDINLFQSLWKEELDKGDPYYDPVLTAETEN